MAQPDSKPLHTLAFLGENPVGHLWVPSIKLKINSIRGVVMTHVGDDTHAHGVTVPDFPGCYSAADSWDKLPAKIQQAVEVYCEERQ